MINLCSLQQPMWKSIGDQNKEGVVSHSSCAHIIILDTLSRRHDASGDDGGGGDNDGDGHLC